MPAAKKNDLRKHFDTKRLKKLQKKIARGDVAVKDAKNKLIHAKTLHPLLKDAENLSNVIFEEYIDPMLLTVSKGDNPLTQPEQAVTIALLFTARKLMWQTAQSADREIALQPTFTFFVELVNKLCAEAEDRHKNDQDNPPDSK